MNPNQIFRSKFYCPSLLFFLIISFCFGCSPKITNFDSRGEEIICFGDSITEGYGAGAGEDYPTLLSQKVNLPVINAGHRGDTTYDALARLDRDVLNRNPRLVIVEFGGNDFLRKVPLAETLSNMDQIVSAVQERGAMVAIAVVKVGPLWDDYTKGFSEIAKDRKALFIPNIMGEVMYNAQYKYDGLHPNAAGYQLIAEKVHKYIKPLLKYAR